MLSLSLFLTCCILQVLGESQNPQSSLISSSDSLLLPQHKTWSPPGDSDVRGPCPALNALANHGFLRHSGRNITVQDFIDATKAGVNLGPDAASAAATAAMATNPTPNSAWIDLDMLGKHNVIEHDGSLSRADAYSGDDLTFDESVFNDYIHRLPYESISIAQQSTARAEHVFARSMVNPEMYLNETLLQNSFFESSLILSIFGDPVKGDAPKQWIETLFLEEKLPTAFGWTPREDETNLSTLIPMNAALASASPPGVPLLFGV